MTPELTKLSESMFEQTTLEWFESLGWDTVFGPDISPDGLTCERKDYGQVVLTGRLQAALQNINPNVPPDAIEEAIRKITRTESPSLIENNRRFHRMLTDGVDVSYMRDGRTVYDKVWLLDAQEAENNDWLAINQFTIIENQKNRRPDIVLFVNGLPLGVIELKNPANEKTTIHQAFNQIQTYKKDIPDLFIYNEILVISDGLKARCGTLSSNMDRFMPWRTIDGEDIAPSGSLELEVLLKGVFEKRRFLDLLLNFVVFEDDGAKITKKAAAYHQYHAVNKAIDCTLKATSEEGDQRIGVIWHTQGSGKSLLMAFFAGKIIRHPNMDNPTLVVITDRNDLDNQLFGTFANCKDLLRQRPVQAADRENLKELLKVPSGGVVFTTIQKFLPENSGEQYPELSRRRNIVVIADEAHRSQYDFIDGFARHMHDALPNASFIGFTGTPIERDDKSTPAVFGDYIDTYDILRAVKDEFTVPIYYEGRLAKIELKEEEKPTIDPEFEEITEGEEDTVREKLRTKWAALEAVVGTEKRISLVAQDLIQHFEDRLEAMNGKALVVCMSRRICVDMYNAIIKLRPHWHNDEDSKGVVKIIMSGSVSDPAEWQPHCRNKRRQDAIAKRFKDPEDPLKVVIVRDMWLTGFDCPPLHTMYVDKPMRAHGLMQAIARVNRKFRDKPGGLVVDYIGLAQQLKQALADYTEAGGRGKATINQEEAVQIMVEKYEVVAAMFHGFDYHSLLHTDGATRLSGIASAMEHILQHENGKKRFLDAVTALSKAFALSVPHEEAIRIRDEVGFFQEVRAGLAKATVDGKSQEELDTAIKQLISRAVASDKVIDIFEATGLKKPNISILSDDFLEEVRQLPQKNLAVELLRKLLNDEIIARSRKNVVQARSFAEMLEKSIQKYQTRTIEVARIIQELIELAKEMRDAQNRGEDLGLTDDEVAFYDALETNDSAVRVLGDEKLKIIAHELVQAVRKNISTDWTVRENARAKIRVIVKRILRKYGYPPDKQEKATQTVLEQAEVLSREWTEFEESLGR